MQLMEKKDIEIQPKIIIGNHYTDERGSLTFNNNFKLSLVKRVYTIANESLEFIRAWQGHKIEQRWFSAISGSFIVKIIQIDNWQNPDKKLQATEFVLKSENFDILHIPAGYVTSIQALKEYSKLLIFANFELDEIKDTYRFPSDYFTV